MRAAAKWEFLDDRDKGEEVNIGRIYRKRKVFQQCLTDHPAEMQDLVDELGTYQFRRADVDMETNRIVNLPDDPRGPEMERKLYKAYLLMREHVDDDRMLFT